MSCTSPVKGFRGPGGRLVMASKDSPGAVPLEVPCGRCMSCRIARKSDWGLRGAHEMSLHEDSSFLTLTYSPGHVPEDWSVSKRALQLFHKRLRQDISPRKIRFLACGEYGDLDHRPHYHVALFGYDFPDRRPSSKNEAGDLLYESEQLAKLWPFGLHAIGALTADSAAYVAGYTCKKITGPAAEAHYTRLDVSTGELRRVSPEFLVCSNRPGIGLGWARRWQVDWVDSGYIVHQGVKRPVPRYYRAKLREALVCDEVVLPSEHQSKEAGLRRRVAHPEEQTERRRAARAELVRLRTQAHRRERLDGVS